MACAVWQDPRSATVRHTKIRLAFPHNLGQFLSYQVAPFLQNGELDTVLEEFEDAPRPIHVVYPHARLLPTRTRAFIDWLRQELKGFEPGKQRA